MSSNRGMYIVRFSNTHIILPGKSIDRDSGDAATNAAVEEGHMDPDAACFELELTKIKAGRAKCKPASPRTTSLMAMWPHAAGPFALRFRH